MHYWNQKIQEEVLAADHSFPTRVCIPKYEYEKSKLAVIRAMKKKRKEKSTQKEKELIIVMFFPLPASSQKTNDANLEMVLGRLTVRM